MHTSNTSAGAHGAHGGGQILNAAAVVGSGGTRQKLIYQEYLNNKSKSPENNHGLNGESKDYYMVKNQTSSKNFGLKPNSTAYSQNKGELDMSGGNSTGISQKPSQSKLAMN